jgi:multisubunit Na+/H+ antiporter MnhE subunit
VLRTEALVPVCVQQPTTSDSNEMASNTKIAIALIFIAALMAANTAVAVRDLQGASACA